MVPILAFRASREVVVPYLDARRQANLNLAICQRALREREVRSHQESLELNAKHADLSPASARTADPRYAARQRDFGLDWQLPNVQAQIQLCLPQSHHVRSQNHA